MTSQERLEHGLSKRLLEAEGCGEIPQESGFLATAKFETQKRILTGS